MKESLGVYKMIYNINSVDTFTHKTDDNKFITRLETKDKKYHLNKTTNCLNKNIQLVHLWEDDWDNKQNIVKPIILNKLVKSKRIFARKCLIKEVSIKETITLITK